MNLRSILVTSLLGLGLALPVSSANAAQWDVDKKNSTLMFMATVFGSQVGGAFESWDAEIQFDEDALDNASVSVTIDMSSVNTLDKTRDSTLQEDDWFATGTYPEATLRSTGFRKTGEGAFEMDADLTMRDVTKAITLPFTLVEESDGVLAKGSIDVIRTDYGVGLENFPTPAEVWLEVNIWFDLVATPTEQ